MVGSLWLVAYTTASPLRLSLQSAIVYPMSRTTSSETHMARHSNAPRDPAHVAEATWAARRPPERSMSGLPAGRGAKHEKPHREDTQNSTANCFLWRTHHRGWGERYATTGHERALMLSASCPGPYAALPCRAKSKTEKRIIVIRKRGSAYDTLYLLRSGLSPRLSFDENVGGEVAAAAGCATGRP